MQFCVGYMLVLMVLSLRVSEQNVRPFNVVVQNWVHARSTNLCSCHVYGYCAAASAESHARATHCKEDRLIRRFRRACIARGTENRVMSLRQ